MLDKNSAQTNFYDLASNKLPIKPVKVIAARLSVKTKTTFWSLKIKSSNHFRRELINFHSLFSLKHCPQPSKQNEVKTTFQDAGSTLKLKAANARSKDRFLSIARTYKKSSWRCRRFSCCRLFCSPATCRRIRKTGRGFPRHSAMLSVFSLLCYHT